MPKISRALRVFVGSSGEVMWSQTVGMTGCKKWSNSMESSGLSQTVPQCCCPIKTWYQQREGLRLCLKANEETASQILALTLFSYPPLAGEFGRCQRSAWILQAMERFDISPGLPVSADSSHMIETD